MEVVNQDLMDTQSPPGVLDHMIVLRGALWVIQKGINAKERPHDQRTSGLQKKICFMVGPSFGLRMHQYRPSGSIQWSLHQPQAMAVKSGKTQLMDIAATAAVAAYKPLPSRGSVYKNQ